MPNPRAIIPARDITFQYVHTKLIHIQELIRWQSIVFRRENHHSLDFAMNDLIRNVELKTDSTCTTDAPDNTRCDESDDLDAVKTGMKHNQIYT
jgi:hypothetical protein